MHGHVMHNFRFADMSIFSPDSMLLRGLIGGFTFGNLILIKAKGCKKRGLGRQ